jgi:N-acyl-D-amino-acid deacylase
MKTSSMILLIIPFLLVLCVPVSSQTTYDADILITGGTIIDGTGDERYRADLIIKDGRIVRIGIFETGSVSARDVIDATGKIVSPGFIDAHAHGDPLQTPEFRNFIAMGVTTITLGQDGASPEYIDLTEWMQRVNARNPAVNIVMFAGHGSIRNLAGVGTDTTPGRDRIDEMKHLIESAMEAGCFGVSTGLEYEPGRFASTEELVAIANAAGSKGGMVMSHMRSEDGDKVIEALDELLNQGKESGTPVHVSHIKVVYGNDTDFAKYLLSRMDETRRAGIRVTADIYPYTASYTGIGIVFPEWARPPNVFKEVVANRRAELAAYLRERVESRNGPEATLFGTAPYAGKTLAQIARELGKPYEDVLIDDIGPGGAGAAYFVMNEEVLRTFLLDPFVMISSDGSPEMRHPRGYGSFARIIRKYVGEEGLLSLEEAIYKMSGLTARTLGLEDSSQPRGFIKEEYAADVLVFEPELIFDRATFEEPHRLAEGFEYVIVNGDIVKEGESFRDQRRGRVLKYRGMME